MSELLTLILKLPLEKLGSLIVQIVQRRILLISLLVLFCLSTVGLLYWYSAGSSRYDDIVVSTLGATVEPTAQSYKGLESFLLSEVDQNLPESVRKSQPSGEFIKSYSALYGDLIKVRDLFSKADKRQADDWSRTFPTLDRNAIRPTLRYVGGPERGEIFTDTQGPGFLFVPLDIIRNGPSLIGFSNFETPNEVQKVNDLVEKDTEIKHDIILSRVLAPDLQSLLHSHLLDDSQPIQGLSKLPAQVYLLSGTGINRIFSNSMQDKNSADGFYATQFGHLTYFPGRPYFTGALALEPKPLLQQEGSPAFQGKLNDYFYVSRPYMDLGGNGLVLTISRRLLAFQEHPIVLCMDFPISGGEKDLNSRLSRMVESFNSPTITATFDVVPTGYVSRVHDVSSCHPSPEQSSLISGERDFIEKGPSQGSPAALADILGNIKRIDNGAQAGKFDVSVPLGVTVDGAGLRSASILLFRLDLAGNRKKTELIGLAGCTCLALFSILLIAFAATSASKGADLQQAMRELNEAFEKVGTVLWDAPIRYTLVRTDDTIGDCNKAMANFNGFEVDELKGRKFRDLIAEKYLSRYDDIEKSRLKNEKVEPYRLGFLMRDDSVQEAWVASAAVPRLNQETGDTLPETFGILLQNRPETRLTLVKTG